MGRFIIQFSIDLGKITKSNVFEFRQLQKVEITPRTNQNSKQKREHNAVEGKYFGFALIGL